MQIYVIGSTKNVFLPLDDIRTKFFVDVSQDGPNIDFLNRWYCELTGLYYMLCNCSDDIIGLEHYRRYFVNDTGTLISQDEINDRLMETDVLLRKYIFPVKFPNAFSHFNSERLPYLIQFIDSFDATEKRFFLDKLSNSNIFAQCNMFIGRRDIIAAYCQWFFRHIVSISFEYMIQSPRIIGYLSEFVFGFWLEYMGVKTNWCPSITLERNQLP